MNLKPTKRFPQNLSAEDEKLKTGSGTECKIKTTNQFCCRKTESRKAALLSQGCKAGRYRSVTTKISVKQPVVVSRREQTRKINPQHRSLFEKSDQENPDTNSKTKTWNYCQYRSNKVGLLSTDVEVPDLRLKRLYTEAKPIPVNARIEDGLIFRVQIGAFKTQLPNNTFRGLSPLNAETTPSGFYRYTAGNFNKYEVANAVKNDLRGNRFTVMPLHWLHTTMANASVWPKPLICSIKKANLLTIMHHKLLV